MGIEPIEHEEQLVHMHINFHSGHSFWFSAVYALCTHVGRRSLWHALQLLRPNRAWMVGEDFNIISSVDERVGANPPNIRNMEEFNDTLFACNLSAVEFGGLPFT